MTMKTTKGQQIAYSIRPFMMMPPKNPKDLTEVIEGIAKEIDKAIASSKYKELLKRLADTGIHSPAKDSNMNKFNVLVRDAMNLMIEEL